MDRHLLLAILNVERNSKRPPTQAFAEEEGNARVASGGAQVVGHSVDLALFTESALRFHLTLSQLSTAKGLGLEYRPSYVDSDAVVELLNSRFGYWTIDSDHDSLYDD